MPLPILTPVLQLGDFDFVGFEEPTEVRFGKEQLTYKHILIGGGRVIDMMGAGDTDISWSGYFTGFQAQYRAQFLQQMLSEGKPLLLKTSQFVKQVVIKDFTWGFHFVFPISYTITLQVIQDQTQPVDFLIPPDITFTIISALIQAQDIAILINNASVSSAIALALIAAQAASPFDQATNVQINAALAAAQNAQAAISAAISNIEGSIFPPIVGKGAMLSAQPLPDLAAESANLIELEQLYTTQNIMNAFVIKNILLVGASPQTAIVTFINPNLYRVAVQYYGNLDYWTVIAQANNLTDPKFVGTIALLIPPQPSVSTGGVINPITT